MSKSEIKHEIKLIVLMILTITLVQSSAPITGPFLAQWVFPHLWVSNPVEAGKILTQIVISSALIIAIGEFILLRPVRDSSIIQTIIGIAFCVLPIKSITTDLKTGWEKNSQAKIEMVAKAQKPNQ